MKFLDIRQTGHTGKTARYDVFARDAQVILGRVSWYAPWRRYVFFPADDNLFDAECLMEVAVFCKTITDEHKVNLHANKR